MWYKPLPTSPSTALSGTRTSWEGEQGGVARVHAKGLQALLTHDARQVHRHDEERELRSSGCVSGCPAGVLVGPDDEDDRVGADSVGDVLLRAVDDVLVAVAHRARLDPRDVRAGARLRDAKAENLPGCDRGHEPLPPLCLGAEGENRRHGHVGVHRDAHRHSARSRTGELLRKHD